MSSKSNETVTTLVMQEGEIREFFAAHPAIDAYVVPSDHQLTDMEFIIKRGKLSAAFELIEKMKNNPRDYGNALFNKAIDLFFERMSSVKMPTVSQFVILAIWNLPGSRSTRPVPQSTGCDHARN